MNTNSSSEIAVEANNLSKVYSLDKKSLIIQKLLSLPEKGFSSLDDVSVKIKKGSCFGILGLNGSGKSTFLQLIAGIIQPNKGEVILNGRLSAIFELGSGFNQDFTGRENIALYASMVGLHASLSKKIESEILDFAEIGEFIDQPLCTYSSGMIARLGFSVRAFLDFDILVLDEVLAVGDMYFQRKCIRLLEKFKTQGKTIIFVSHNINQVLELCDEAMVLQNGKLSHIGNPKECAYHYFEMINAMRDDQKEKNNEISRPSKELNSNYGCGRCSLKSFHSSGNKIENGFILKSLEYTEFTFTVIVKENVIGLEFGLNIRTKEGTVIAGRHIALGDHKKGASVVIRVSFTNMLNKGHYFLSCGITSEVSGKRVFENRYLDFMHISVPDIQLTESQRNTGSFLLFEKMRMVETI